MWKRRGPPRPRADVVTHSLIPLSAVVKGTEHLACDGLPTEGSVRASTLLSAMFLCYFRERSENLIKDSSLHQSRKDPEYQGGTCTKTRDSSLHFHDNFAPYHIPVTMQGIFPLLPSEKRILLVGSSSKPSLIRTLQIRLEKQMMGKCACSILCWIFSTVKQNNWWPQHTLAHRWCIYDG